MPRTLGIGVIGCGNISASYMALAPLFKGIEMRACADVDPDAAAARAAEYGLRAQSVDDLLASPDIDIVVNLTVPVAHYDISRRILQAGKHSYSEKPFVLTLPEAESLRRLADASGLRIGSAPDTFMGAAHQLARAAIDEGRVGPITGGTCHVMSSGMEDWHPNPDFFFQPGAGPILDLGPYYITNLVQLIGPVASVAAMTGMGRPTRTIGSGPRMGQEVPVATPTNIHALLQFANGAIVTLGASWDVKAHGHSNMELYGHDGTIFVPDPNFFGGEVRIDDGAGETRPDDRDHPFGRINKVDNHGIDRADYRGAGLADMAAAIIEGRPHRCGLDLATHVVEVMQAILQAGHENRVVRLTTTCTRPEALDPDAAQALLV
ncbi:Gfo/Idh/MocA family oxidoreductase [Paracoccus sp. 1_MG-2023]|uniref:Gfo/Idh/MocA family protein n=1 Tax=unclassified Paracoccus (in: a-proteobacteria) TaxID=2688777 RepID=UPI001C09D080|nr:MULTISPECIES: Gfo/Idh/MocA family oxidoreductase [unclassified Paracoccus (in: a-proteobacteria)]MBU2957982.1 Gfo/Idh/MocA family oxidoreductase [Paracoccus sp. C2R09]MDO6668824.1 Gfo/Idh/MocA family oxidoreductase [Paracoccus sp. 1_MG-2023]